MAGLVFSFSDDFLGWLTLSEESNFVALAVLFLEVVDFVAGCLLRVVVVVVFSELRCVPGCLL